MIDFIYQYEAIIRLSVFLSGFTLLALWEWYRPKRKLTQDKFKRWINNIALVVCSTIVVRFVVPAVAIGVAYMVEQKQWGIANVFEFPLWLKVVATFILLDMTIYFQHTIFHVLPLMWRIHRVHHSDLDCDVTTGLRFHPIEILLSIIIKFIAIAALGAPVLAVILFELALNLMSMFTHSNIRLNKKFERVLRWFIVTPDMHRIHHSARENETNSNFSFNFSLWDRIFGTYLARSQDGHQSMTIGLDQYRAPVWQNLKGLMMMPFNSSIQGYAINYRDTINTDEFSRVNELVHQQTKFLKQARDVTEQKNKELHDTVSRLTESESLQRMLIENMLDGFISIDEKGLIHSFNPAAEKIFGYKINEVIGKPVGLLMTEYEAAHHDSHLTQYKKMREHRVIGISRDIEGKRKDGSTFPMDIALKDLHVRGQQIFTAVVRDISDRKNAELKIIAEKEKAEKASRAKTEFLNSMSHELRTPLNAIIGFSELLSMQKSIDPILQEQVAFIQEAGTNLLEQVENVLNLSQIEEGEVKYVIANFTLVDLLNECNSLINPLLEKLDIQLRFELKSKSNTIRSDRKLLKQILLNLLSNAIKYNNQGGQVTLTTSDYNSEGLRIAVSDGGPGIDPLLLKKIFEPFNRLGFEGSNISGTGIGLSISKELIELMEGSIGVESIVGQGSNFWIDLPHARS